MILQDGIVSTDRAEWRKDAPIWGRSKYGSEWNIPEIQHARYDTICAEAHWEQLDGRSQLPPTFTEYLQAIAALKQEKNVKGGGTVAEMYQSIPYLGLCHLYNCFCRYFKDLRMAPPENRKHVELCGIPKGRRPNSWQQFRWIGKSETLMKIYQRWLIPELERQLKPTKVNSVGFSKGFTSDNVSGFIREMLTSHDRWGEDNELVISSQDVRTAFDEMEHSEICKGMHMRGISSHMCAAVLRDLQGIHLKMDIPGAGTTDEFDMEKGGIQGGSATPFCFRTMLEAIMEPLVHDWDLLGYGARTLFGERISHILWADNIWLFSNCMFDMQTMVQQLTFAIHQSYFRWKVDSLEYMVISISDNSDQCLRIEQEGVDLDYKEVEQMWVLGTLMTPQGGTPTSVHARIRIASKQYFKHQLIWGRAGDESLKINIWVEVFHGSMLHGARNWHLSARILRDIRSAELCYVDKEEEIRCLRS